MKITMYELLGMIKEGTAPKKIKNDSVIYIYDEIREDYYDKVNDKYFINMLFNRFKTRFALVRKVEIIEEPQEHKIPEKINVKLGLNDENKVNDYTATNLECYLALIINEIIDYLEEIE